MTIDKQALREEFRCMQDHYSDPADRERQEIYIAAEALLDELDSANGYASVYEAEKWHYHGLAESEGERADRAEKRVAELESIATDYGVKFQKAQDALKHQALLHKSQMEAAEKRIAELESNEVREVGNQFLVVRHPGKTPVIKHCTGDPEEFLRKLIEQDPLVTIDIITHRYYGIGGQWVQDAVEYLHMMSDAGVRIKGE